MKRNLSRILFSLTCLAILVYIFWFTTPPKTWEEASIAQILAVFLPILVLGTILADRFFKYLPRSFLVGLGVMVIAVLQALKQLTPLITLGIILAAILSARLFPKIKSEDIKNIPKLRLSNIHKESTLTKFKRRHKS